nr:MAG TPA: DnaK suppressor protein [Caudoviricetes sp.]
MIFNEYERAAEIDEKQKFSTDIMVDGILLARFYKTNGLSKEETREKIAKIINALPGCFVHKFKENCIRDIMSGFDSFELMDNEPVCFYKEEMDVISKLENKTARKVLFALLYIKKASKQDVFEASIRDINRICIKRINQDVLYRILYELKETGYMRYTNFKGRNKKEIICPALNIQYASEPVIAITNKHNIINYYLNYIGEGKFAICKNCGKLVPVTSFNVDYCDKCAIEVDREKTRKRVEKFRNSNM